MADNIVIIKNKNSSEAIELVRLLKSQGYAIGVDFDFEYSAGKWDYMIGNIPSQIKFTFKNTKLLVWFALKYC